MRFDFLTKAAVLFIGFAALCFCEEASARKLVILHTNDTHSTIEPSASGMGGVLQRKAVIDSVRNAEKFVITVDAGDMVQGSLFFKYFRGDVEYPLMDMTGYDIRVLGNHEFDNGMKDLAEKYRNVRGSRLSANYDFKGTDLEGVFEPYVIKKIGGRKVGFFGLNIDPSSLISSKNIEVNFKEVIPVANEVASYLKHKKKCDLVVAVSHIGYTKSNGKTTDVELARASHDIDIIIGGHSHTLIDPAHPDKFPSLIQNADGQLVRVVQAGKYGYYIGKLTVDLDSIGDADGDDFEYELIAVTDRFPEEKLDKEMIDFLKPYKEVVDSVNSRVIGKSLYDMRNDSRTGGLPNLTADFGYWYGNHKVDSLRACGVDITHVDLSVMNVGGIRQNMPCGDITEGQILSTYPFSNHFTIIALKGYDIVEAMKVAAGKGGEAVSGNVRVLTDGSGNFVRMIIDGEEIDPERTYNLATIDYLAEGNDDMTSLANHDTVWIDEVEVAAPILRWFEHQGELGLPVAPDCTPRFQKVITKLDCGESVAN